MLKNVSTPSFFLYVWRIIVYVYYCSLYRLGLYIPPKSAPTISSLSDIYIEKRKQHFLSTYENLANFNESVDPIFYNKTEYKQVMETPNNPIETYWKKRILLENTPRGNIIMYYDAYKLGFVYYCDNSSLPYSLINAVVMKYVTTFRCRDFFIDVSVKPESKDSPILTLYKDDPTKKTEAKIAKPTSNAFAKLKNYREDTSKPVQPQQDQKNTNTIIYQGKIFNFSILQSIPKAIPKPKSSIVFDSTPVESYSEYKKRMAKQPQQQQNTAVNYVC